MPFYSTEALAAAEGDGAADSRTFPGHPQEKVFCKAADESPWCYLFIPRHKLRYVIEKLETHYTVFVHKRIYYKRTGTGVKRLEQATFSGLVFVQGSPVKVQKLVGSLFYGVKVAHDCCTRRWALIPHAVMKPFMTLSASDPTRVRFMPHPLSHYEEGHTLVRITSGPMAGLEGYRLRIARDKCLLTTLGGLTVAIKGINKDSFENIDEYVRLRRSQLGRVAGAPKASLSPLQRDIDRSLFVPSNELDLLAFAHELDVWVAHARQCRRAKDYDTATETALFLLEEIGAKQQAAPLLLSHRMAVTVRPAVEDALGLLSDLLASSDVPTDLKDVIEASREMLGIRYALLAPFLSPVKPS